jgi:hypothetical protein
MIYQVDSKEIHRKMLVAFSDCFQSSMYPVDLEAKVRLFLKELCDGSDEYSKDLKNVWKKFYPEFKALKKSEAQWNVHLEIIFSAAALEYFCQRDQIIPPGLVPVGGLQSINDPIQRENIAFQVFKLYSQHYFTIFQSKAMGDYLKVVERLEGSLNDYKTGSGATELTEKRWKYLHELTGKEYKPRTNNKKRKGTDNETAEVAILEHNNDDITTTSSAGSDSSTASFKKQKTRTASSVAASVPCSWRETASHRPQTPPELDFDHLENVQFFDSVNPPSDVLIDAIVFGAVPSLFDINDFPFTLPEIKMGMFDGLDGEIEWMIEELCRSEPRK